MSEAPPAAPATPTPPPPSRERGRRRRALWRVVRRTLLVLTAVIAALILLLVSVDIGGWFHLRELAEREGTKRFGRKLTIGRIGMLLLPGNFEVDDVRIDGLKPEDRPFFAAKRITAHLEWGALLSKRIALDVGVDDWEMTIEMLPDGTNSFPKKITQSDGSKPSTWVKRAQSVFLRRGKFTYDDHGAPWSITANDVSIKIVWVDMLKKYMGSTQFTDGVTQIQKALPMTTEFSARYSIEEGGILKLPAIDIVTDGAVTHAVGSVDFKHFPEQQYKVTSRVQFPAMRRLFFDGASWDLSGEGNFDGSFHLFKGGRALEGAFTSGVAGLHVDSRAFYFPNLRGHLLWNAKRFDVTEATSELYGGKMQLKYGIGPFGQSGGATATFSSDYTRADLAQARQIFDWRQRLALEGLADGHHEMTWRNGHFSESVVMTGRMTGVPSSGVALATTALPAGWMPAAQPDKDHFDRQKPLGVLPVGGDVFYRYTHGGLLEFNDSWVATPNEFASFHGQRDPEGQLSIPVHLASRDWQASDRLLAAIMAELKSPTKVIQVGGGGTFDGEVSDTFSNLRVAGHFAGESLYAFDNLWGRTTGDIVLQNNFVEIKNGLVGQAGAKRLDINGRFALGFRPDPKTEELRGTFHIEQWPLQDFKNAFGLKDWPINGIGTADLDLRGPYRHLTGTGRMTVTDGEAWKEPFESATTDLTFEGTGMRMGTLVLSKGPGRVFGTALVKWDNTYSFDVKGQDIHVDTLKNFAVSKAPLTGILRFDAQGAASFDAPTYSFQGRVDDLFVGDEGVGGVAGHLTIRGKTVTIDQLDLTSARTQAHGNGTIAFDDHYTSDIKLTFTNTSFDPYFKFFTDASWFQYTQLIAGGSLWLKGPLAELENVAVSAQVDDVALKLFDYQLRNDGPLYLTYRDKSFTIGDDTCTAATQPRCQLNLRGVTDADTQMRISGSISRDSRIYLQGDGSANLQVLRAFKLFSDVETKGNAQLHARLVGDYDSPSFLGSAVIEAGELKFPWLSRRLTKLNGPISFDANAIGFDGLHGEVGEGPVDFGGRILLKDFKADQYDLRIQGTGMNLRGVPQHFDSRINANLWVRGPFAEPTLGGDVVVINLRPSAEIEADVGLIALAASTGGETTTIAEPSPLDVTTSMALAVNVRAAPMFIIDTKDLKLRVATEDLTIRGTVSRPIVGGRIDVIGGQWVLSGNLIRVQPGWIEFSDPVKFDPYFNLNAEAPNARASGQSVRIILRAQGTLDKPQLTLRSEPPMSENDIIAILLGGSPDYKTSDVRQVRDTQSAEMQLLATVATQVLTARSGVNSVLEKALPLDTISFTPKLLQSDVPLQNVNPGARVALGKRISDSIYLIYYRDLNSPTLNEFILLEIDQSNRVQWILTRNEDRSISFEFRLRRIF